MSIVCHVGPQGRYYRIHVPPLPGRRQLLNEWGRVAAASGSLDRLGEYPPRPKQGEA